MITVLTVDDEMLIKRTLKKLIEYEGSPFTVIGEAEDGQEALDFIRDRHPDVVITDIRMPVMDGLELVREAVKLKPDIRFIILSGHDDFMYAQQAIRDGVAEYMLKPLKPDQLREVLGRVEERLLSRAQTELDRLGLLWYCKNQVEQLVENLWLLNGQEMLSQLADIHETFVHSEDESAVRSYYLSFLTLLDGALAEKSGGAFRLELSLLERFPKQVDRMRETLSDECARISNDIRQNRNWLSHQNMKKASAYLQKNYMQVSLSLQEVADVVGISPSYFSRMFKEEHGISFIHYITKLRMERACELLADPDSKTYEVSYAIGYQDYPHFTKVFKKMYGFTPSDYRKRIGVKENEKAASDHS